MLIRADLTHRCFIARIAVEADLDQIVIFHAKPFSESLARRLKLRADDDSAQIKEDSPYAHVLFFVVAFLTLGDDVNRSGCRSSEPRQSHHRSCLCHDACQLTSCAAPFSHWNAT